MLTFVGSSDEQEARERELAEAFSARGVDGLVIVPCAGDQSYLLRDRQAGTALVFVDRPPRFIPGDAVLSDNRGGARTAVAHLLACGHRRIAFLGDRESVFTAVERRAGYHEALGAARFPELERLGLFDSELGRGRGPRAVRVGRAADRAVHRPEPGHDRRDPGAARARPASARSRWSGFDDVVLGDLVEPGITVVAQDPYALGRHAGELLFSAAAGAADRGRPDAR